MLAFVMQIWVYGNSLESTLVAVAVPNEAVIKEWAKSNGSEDDMAKLCQDPKAQAYILSQLNLTGKAKKVNINGKYLIFAGVCHILLSK